MAKTKTKSKQKAPAKKKPTAAPAIQFPSYPPLPLPRIITSTLSRVSSKQLRVNWAECLVLLLAIVPGLWLLQGSADWFFDLPWVVRFLLLVADLAVVGYVVWRFAIVPWQKRLNQQTAALQVEKELPGFRSGLISAVQLSKDRSGVPGGSTELVETLIQSVAAKLQGVKVVKHVVNTKRLMHYAKLMACVAVVVVLVLMFAGTKTPVLLQRILLANVPLPKQTIVIPITKDGSIAIGTDIPLSARADGVIPKSGVVEVVYDNGERQNVSVSPSAEEEGVFSMTLRNVHQPFTYRFMLNDGVGPQFRVDAKQPPVLATLDAMQEYPAYTSLETQKMQMGNLELLAGSMLKLEGVSTQPLKSAKVVLEGLNQEVDLRIGGDGKSVSGSFQVPKEGLTGVSFSLVNQDGVSSQENTMYRVTLVPDAVPQLELLVPATEQMSIVPGVKPTLVYTVRDDFNLSKVALKYEIVPPASAMTDDGGDEGADAEPKIGTVSLKRPESPSAGKPQQHVWDLSKVTPAPMVGGTIRYWVEAEDFNNVTGPGVGKSAVKSFSVVSEDAKQAELMEKLSDIAAELDDVYKKQKKASETLDSAIRQNQD